VPSGILQPSTVNLIGPGVVVDPRVLLHELDEIQAQGVLRDPSRVRVSGRAHVILDWHVALDKARDEARREGAIGTTGRGIGPAYEDKVARRGIRVADLLDPAVLVPAIERLATEKNFELTQLHGWPAIDPAALTDELIGLGRRLEPFVDHTGRILDRALRENKKVLFEGAQGTFLDVDHGTYPYVTSSNCVPAPPAPARAWARPASTAPSASPRLTPRASAAVRSRPRTPARAGSGSARRAWSTAPPPAASAAAAGSTSSCSARPRS
jgi:adenylosuccinate synthase